MKILIGDIGAMKKEDQIKLALKVAIEERFPFTSIHKKADELRLSDSQVSKILGRQKLLPLLEIIRLEQLLGVEIIKVVQPEVLSQSKKHNFSDKTALSEKSLTKKTLFDELPEKVKLELRKVIDDLENELNPLIHVNHLRFTERPTSSYISINLLPDSNNIYNTKGIHLLFFKKTRKDKTIRVQFIIPNDFFESEIQAKKVIRGGTQTTYLPFKKIGKPAIMKGQPYLDMGSNILEFKKTIISLALRVYELQTMSI